MFRIISIGARVRILKSLFILAMSKDGDQIYYAVGRGRETGIYNSWLECKSQVEGITNAKYRKFFSLEEAKEFIKFWKNYSSPSKIINNENPVSKFSRSGDNFQRPGNTGFEKVRKKILALGAEEAPDKRNPVGLRPYVSPIPYALYCHFHDDNNVRNLKNLQKHKKKTSQRKNYSAVSIRKNSVGACADLDLTGVKSSNNFVTYTPAPVKIVDASSQITIIDSQSANVPNEPVIKKELVEEDEIGSRESSKQSKCLKMLELALKEIAEGRTNESEKIGNILRKVLETISETNYPINPQMDSEGSELEGSKNNENEDVRAEEPVSSQQQTALLSPVANTPTSPAHRSSDQRNPEILALNLRLDSFEKRFDSCLKEVGAIVSEISHIRAEIKEIKECLGQSPSACSPRKKRKDGLIQTTLSFASPDKLENTRLDSSSIESSTDAGASREAETEVHRSNRGKRRRLSRSDSSGSSKGFVEDADDDISNRIKIEKDDVAYTSFCLDENDFVEVYTDGACHYNGEREAKAGIGIWFGDNHPLNVSEPVMGSPTNNVAEIQAARIAIELAIKAGVKKLKIFTDSEFLINCVTKWIHRWKRNGWTLVRGGAVKNRKELEKLDRVSSKISVRWEKVLAHSGIKGNEMADRLANQGAEKYTR